MKKPRVFSLSGNIVDVVNRRVFPGTVQVENGLVKKVEEGAAGSDQYLFPGLIDAHVHIESSMLVPAAFARLAVVHGTVGTVSDPHEIANVLGVEGVEFMIENGKQVPFRFYFGAPSCVPATGFEAAGATITPADIEKLLQHPEIRYLAEMMNFPGVVHQDKEVMEKIAHARRLGKVVDGHAPGLAGDALQRYAQAGISTDHECFTLEEAREKLALGMKVLIREGSAAKNFEALIPLMATHPESLMLCSDDKHPDDLVHGHINSLVKRALAMGYDLFDVLRSATLNPKEHYGLGNGLLQPGHPADIMVVNNLQDFSVLETYIEGQLVARHRQSLLSPVHSETPNRFHCNPIRPEQLQVPVKGPRIRVIGALDGQLITENLTESTRVDNGMAVSDPVRDILKLVVQNRYQEAPPAVAFIRGFGLREGALASTVAHDSHNIIAVGASDQELARAINLLVEARGGIAVVGQGEEQLLPLPVAGIMTPADGKETAARYQQLDAAAKRLGSTLSAPFMTLSFMALLVIPQLKLSDKGLFDGKTFQHVSMFTD
jgi:adenine deaminase